MPAVPDTAEVPQATRFERALDSALVASHASGKSECDAFWRSWSASGQPVPCHLADFRAVCERMGSPLAVLHLCGRLVTGASNEALRRSAKPSLRRLVKSILLAASERYLCSAISATPAASDTLLAVHVQDPFTAALLAAGRSGSGARVVPNTITGRPTVQNVLSDSPARAYTEGDADVDAWGAELDEWSRTVLEHPESWLDPAAMRASLGSRPWAVEPELVRLQLMQVADELQMRPLIAVSPNAPGTSGLNAALLAKLMASFGELHAFMHVANSTESADRAAKRLETTVENYVSAIFAAIDPAFSVKPPPPIQVTGRREVFICYAHADGDQWLKAIQSQIRALGGDIPIQPWSDEAIHTGDDWEANIDEALDRAACAVLIVAAGFLGSAFIQKHEVPHLLKRRASGQLHVLPILARPCNHQTHHWLSPLQMRCINAPLSSLSDNDAEAQTTALAGEIFAKLQLN